MRQHYRWPLVEEFLDRREALHRLESWWHSDERMPVAVYGRRRIGKSWLIRQFAHGKPATVLVADQVTTGMQLERFATELEPLLDVRPDIPNLAALLKVLFQTARKDKLLVAIDEFPYLLPTNHAEAQRVLSTLLVVLEEERDTSELKLLLSGSAVAQMESLFAERNPLHGRLVRHELRPLTFAESGWFLEALQPMERFERFAISGGMPRYLSLLGSGPLRTALCRAVLDRDAPLWNEARAVLDRELRQPGVYFAILEQLSTGRKEVNEIAQAVRQESKTLTPYLNALAELRLIRRHLPVGATTTSRGAQWQLEDPFMRFWFRFVFPYQAELASGLSPEDLFDTEIVDNLADHVAPAFEDWCRGWVRRMHGRRATQVGAWWGPALHRLRRSGERSSEEIDIVGMARGRVTIVGEVKWTNRKLGMDVMNALHTYKIPAMQQAGLKMATEPTIVLFSRSGYTPDLMRAAGSDEKITLIDVNDALAEAEPD